MTNYIVLEVCKIWNNQSKPKEICGCFTQVHHLNPRKASQIYLNYSFWSNIWSGDYPIMINVYTHIGLCQPMTPGWLEWMVESYCILHLLGQTSSSSKTLTACYLGTHTIWLICILMLPRDLARPIRSVHSLRSLPFQPNVSLNCKERETNAVHLRSFYIHRILYSLPFQ